MYINFEDLSELVHKGKIYENSAIFIEYLGQLYEPDDITIDEDGDIIFRV